MSESYTYQLHIDPVEGGYAAYLDDPASPLRGEGITPLDAVRALCAVLAEWPVDGARRWLEGDESNGLRLHLGMEKAPGRVLS